MTDSDAPQYFDLITTGRIGVDLYPLETGVPLVKVETFGKFLGGSGANVAVATARLGRATAVVTRTGDDPFGTYLHEALKEFGAGALVASRLACSSAVPTGPEVEDLFARTVPPGDASLPSQS